MNDVINFNDFVMLAGDKLVTDTRRVAKHFGKRHDDVLRKARKVIHDAGDFALRNFTECFENNALANGKPEPVYQMTKDGFMLLVMGFTGKKAMQMKISFIGAFNTMSDQLQRRYANLWQEMQALIAREVESKVRASFGSHLMLKRKREIPGFRAQHAELEDKIQQPLFISEARH